MERKENNKQGYRGRTRYWGDGGRGGGRRNKGFKRDREKKPEETPEQILIQTIMNLGDNKVINSLYKIKITHI